MLLISTRILSAGQERQWIIPQGEIEPWQTPIEAGTNEAWEEAGIKGKIEKKPLTSFSYKNQCIKYIVLYYPLEVKEELRDWPEKMERSRIWINISKAKIKIRNEKLREVFKIFEKFLKKK